MGTRWCEAGRMSTSAVDVACAALRSFVHLSGALRAQALVPAGGGGEPAIVSCVRLGPLEVSIGERSITLPHDAELDAVAPDLGALGPLPAFAVDPGAGEVTGMLGGLDRVGDAVMTIAHALGPDAAVVVELETTAPDLPLVVSARAGEPVLVLLGDDEFEL